MNAFTSRHTIHSYSLTHFVFMKKDQQEKLKEVLVERCTMGELENVLTKMGPALLNAINAEGKILSSSKWTMVLSGRERQMHQTSLSMLTGSHMLLNGIMRYIRKDLTDEEFLSALTLKQ